MSTTNNQQTDYITPAQTMTPAERQWQQLWQDIENAEADAGKFLKRRL